MVKGFSKMYNFSFFGQILFCKHFYYITGFCDKKILFLQIFLQILKVEHKSFLMMYHKTWDLEGGGQIDPPPQRILVFKYPSRDRVNAQGENSKIEDEIYKKVSSLIKPLQV